eukprot:361250-Chlamydomonas_euryale.AAC.22
MQCVFKQCTRRKDTTAESHLMVRGCDQHSETPAAMRDACKQCILPKGTTPAARPMVRVNSMASCQSRPTRQLPGMRHAASPFQQYCVLYSTTFGAGKHAVHWVCDAYLHSCIHSPKRPHAHTPTRPHAHTHARTHARTRTRVRARTHTHTRTQAGRQTNAH